MTETRADAKRGVFLTLDSVIGMLVLFMAVVVAFHYYSQEPPGRLSGQMLSTYAQDAATVASVSGYLAAPLDSGNSSNTSGIRTVIDSVPDSVCMQIEAYGIGPTDSLVAYWRMDEEPYSTSASDYSPNGFSGFVSNSEAGPFFARGISGGGFSSSSSFINVSHHVQLEPQSLTVAAWVYRSETGSTSTIATKRPGFALEIGANDLPYLTLDRSGGATTVTSAATVGAGRWAHIAGTYDNFTKNLSIYVDGELAGTAALGANSILYSQSQLQLSANSTALDGTIDEVRLYSRALPLPEIEKLYSNPSNLAYSEVKQGCAYAGGEIQALSIPFSHNSNQGQNNYYSAVIKVWLRGAGR